jgi:cobalt-zinc-cadmium resistance protein CzcA
MIENIILFSIRNRIAVIIATGFLLIVGIFNAAKLSIDAVPDITNVQVSAVTSSPGLSPLEVEQFITYPIELEFNGMPKVREIRSISRTGVSAVTIIFEDGTDIFFARQLVNERLKQAEEIIPAGYGKPELSPIATGLGDIYEFSLSSDVHTKEELKTYMKWEVARQLRSVKGIIDVNIYGGDEKQFQIKIDPRRLQALNLTLSSIADSLESANMNVGGGYISKGEEQIVIRGESQFKNAEEIRKVAIRTSRDGIPVLLGQIAIVEEGAALHFGLATQDGKGEVVTCTTIMLMGQNSLEVVKSVKEKVLEIESKLPEGMKIRTFYDRSEFISRTLTTVFTNLIEAAVLVLIILIITLGSVKGALAVAFAIPVSMLTATIFMNMFGVIGNLMSLGALDFGLLVDGSIVMLEAVLHGFIYKRAVLDSQNSKQDLTLLTEDIILKSCQKVARASTFSVGIIMLVYLPLMTLEGTEGRMFRPMAITVALALGAALIYSLTAFPAILAILFKEPIFKEPAYWEKLKHFYEINLAKVMLKRTSALTMGLGVTIFCLMLSVFLGSEFLPKIDEGELEIDIKRLPSTSLVHSKQLNTELEKVLLTIPEVTLATARMGRGDSPSEPVGTEEGTVMAKLRPRSEWTQTKDREELMEIIKNKLVSNVPSSYISISQPIENKVNALLSGSKADIVIKIFGDDLESLKKIADDYAKKIKSVPGSADLRVQRLLGLPLLEIKADREKMARYGVSSEEILTTVQTLRVGYDVGKVYEGYKRFDLIIRLDANVKDMDVLQNVPVMSSMGESIPLGQVASIEVTEGPSALYHDGLKRRILVETNVRGRDMIGFVNEAMEVTADIEKSLPSGYTVDWGGQFENFTRAKTRLSIVVPVALAIIFGMLFIAFGNIYYALGVFILVPFSAAGGVLALVLRGLPFSIPAGVGFIAAAGISVLNGVVFASYLKNSLEQNGKDEEEEDVEKIVTEASVETLRAVITTVLVAVIGFLPMAIASSAGAEVQRPLATVVIGGVLFATLMALFLLPPVFQFLVIAALKREEATEKLKLDLEVQFTIEKRSRLSKTKEINFVPESSIEEEQSEKVSENKRKRKKR